MIPRNRVPLPLALCLAHAARAATSVTGLGDLPGGITYSNAYGVSDDGQVVVGESSSSASKNREAFVWTPAGGITGLGLLPGGTYSTARAVSRDGKVVVGSGDSTAAIPAGGVEGFRRDASGMTGLHVPQVLYDAFAVSGDGSVVVASNSSLRWTAAAGVEQNVIPYSGFGISADGSVVVGRSSGFRAQRWTAATGVTDLPGNDVSSVANAVSADGAIAVGQRINVACYWTAAQRVDIGPAGAISAALAVNGDGSVIVGRANNKATGATEAFVWTAADGLRTLASILAARGVDVSHWKNGAFTELTGISADGRWLVGNSVTTANKGEGFIVHLDDGTAPTALEQWRQSKFGSAANSGPGADAADFDGDGLPNLLEYALGTDPKSPSPGAGLAWSGTPGALSLVFARIADPDLTYAIEAQDALAATGWQAVWTSTGSANVAGPVSVAAANLAGNQPARFLRLRVSHP